MAGKLKNWTIKDSIFYPLGLFNNASRNKTVFVTWSYNTLITYIFKKTESSNPLKNTYKILLNGTIHEIIVTEFNTLCLTQSGHMYYFSSCKSLKRLEFLNGVCCITSTPGGFALIKVTDENRLNLETYNDFTNSSEAGQGRRTFDISFDENNLLNSSWTGEKFCIYSFEITAENREFLGFVAKQNVDNAESVYFFTINNSLFGLISDGSTTESDYGIFLIHTVASEIDSIRFLSELNLILIFMSCGMMEIIFYSKLTKLLDRATHNIGSGIVSTTFADDCFYFSDSKKVVRCRLVYDENYHSIQMRRTEKHLYGVVAITWVKTVKKLICLSENNVFYRIRFEQAEPDRDTFEFFELSRGKIKEIEQHFNKLLSLADEPKAIQTRIKSDYHKQQVMSIFSKKTLFSNLIQAKINFSKNLPSLHGFTIYPINGAVITNNSYFGTVEIQIKPNPIFETGMWRISVDVAGETRLTKQILINSEIIKQQSFTILLHLNRGSVLIIPEIRIELTSCIQVESDFMYISIPSHTNRINFGELFTPTIPMMVVDQNQKNRIFSSTIAEENPQIFKTRIKTPLLMSLDELYEIFKVVNFNKDLVHHFSVYFFGEKINIEYSELENAVEITCEDPGALHYTKIHLSQKLYCELYRDDSVAVKDSIRPLLKLQAELEAKGGAVQSEKLYGTALKKFYLSMRSGEDTRI